jgi:membrane peptidoglycan carboxypeptidase
MAKTSRSRSTKRRTSTGGNRKGGAQQSRLQKVVRWGLITSIVGVIVLLSVFFLAYHFTKIPNPNSAFQAQASYVTYAGGKQRIGQFAEQNRASVPLSEISRSMQDAAIAAEDRSFWTNRGIDPKGIIRAAFSNARGNSTQGASTITQQYVKLLYLNQERTFSRKIKEAFLSLKVQQQRSKSEILQGYLNTVYFGRGSYGVEAAAKSYFGIKAKDLDASQSAMLAAILNSPSYLSPDNEAGHDSLLNRYDYVLNGMVAMGNLDEGEASQYRGELPKVIKPKTSNTLGGQRGFAMDMVKKALLKIGFSEEDIQTGGLRIQTTLTPQAMKAVEDGINAVKPEGKPDLHAAAASIDVKTGKLLGFYAGQDYLKSQLNWAMLGGSPGSSFKPFALAAGITDGFSLKDTFQGNSPLVLKDGQKIKNEGSGNGTSYGSRVSLLKATEDSINTAYVDMTESMADSGPVKVMDMAIDLGIPKKAPGLEPNIGISLGSATISPIDMANAYASIANGGMANKWYIVGKVTRGSDGKVLYEHEAKPRRALDEDIDRDVSYAMQQVVRVGTGRNASALGRPAAGKTGTATNAKDQVSSSWFVGYTPQVSTAVMYVRGKGNEGLDGGYLSSYYGGTFPAQTWAAIMRGVLDGLPVESFPPPAWVDGEAPNKGHDPAPENNNGGRKKGNKNKNKDKAKQEQPPAVEPTEQVTPEPPEPPVSTAPPVNPSPSL